MLDDLVPRRSAETTHYERVFRLEDGSGGAFAFACDARGNAFLGGLPPIARHSLERCLQEEADGFRVRPGVVRPSTQSYTEPGSGRCGGCGRAYDGDGTPLADPGRGG